MTEKPSSADLLELQDQQTTLLQALLGNQTHSALATRQFNQRGLQAYQAHGEALAERALAAAYPVIAQLIGPDNFQPMSRYYWQQHPPRCSDMALWGGELPAFIAAAPQLADEPYLADVARVEWALHRIQTAADSPLDGPSFALLTMHDPDQLTLTLCTGLHVFSSPYPVASIINAHLFGMPTLAEAASLLADSVGENTLVWRQGFKPCARRCSRAEFTFISSLQAGRCLASALDAALASTPQSQGPSSGQGSGQESDFPPDDNAGTNRVEANQFDFNHWLGQAVQEGLVTGASTLLSPVVNRQGKPCSNQPAHSSAIKPA